MDTYEPTEQRWDPDMVGNHRAVIEVDTDARAVRVHVPWRRRDAGGAGKGVVLIAQGTEMPVRNVTQAAMSREAGTFVFEPEQGLGTYFLYTMPYTGDAQAHYPKLAYAPYAESADPAWKAEHGLDNADESHLMALPAARFVRMESVDDHNAFTRMEIPASDEELAGLLRRRLEEPFMLFTAERTAPIRMRHDIPAYWAVDDAGPFVGQARPGEFYVFQVGVFAAQADLQKLTVTFSDLRFGESVIPSRRLRCLNLGGTGWDGQPFSKRVDVVRGDVQALWCGVDVPPDALGATYEGEVAVGADGQQARTIAVTITVAGGPIANAGDDEPWRLSRLRWLDSTKGSEDELVRPFTAIERSGLSLRILGREIALAPRGLPSQLTSYFTPEMTGVGDVARPLLAGPLRFLVTSDNGEAAECSTDNALSVEGNEARAAWQARSKVGTFDVSVSGELEFDGNMEFSLRLSARQATSVRDISLHIPFADGAARYMTGLGRKGGPRPESFTWQWDVAKNQDAFWIGDVNVGLQVTLKDESYSRPLNTNFYHLKPLVLPESWHNAGRGSITMGPAEGGTFPVVCSSGPRTLAEGETVTFKFRLMLTPFKPLDTMGHFRTRFYHAPLEPHEIVANGANTVNIHHANDLNPYINYPFFRTDALRRYVADAHALGCRVKLYYTVRELTTRAAELFALMSLGDEVIVDGPGGGHAWLMEHLAENYIAAWHAPNVRDTSVIDGVLSRWHNHYVEGLDWLARTVGIDGVYIDDLGFGREIMKRVRRVLARHRAEPIIDLHSANQFNEKDGFAGSMNLYMEHLPYIDRLWFGEYFDYNESPEYWLVDVAGIPFGVMSEMLQDGGNPWRGMVFGMTGRLPRVKLNRAIWAFWDEFALPDSDMIGWWSPACPVRACDDRIRCTAYVSDKRVIVAVASWHAADVAVTLDIDWAALRIGPDRARLHAPPIPGFQEERSFAPGQAVPIEAGRGWLIVVEESE